MSPASEELLYYLFWAGELVLCPSRARLEESFEQWAWRNQLARRIAALQRQRLLEIRPAPNLDRIVGLSESGRAMAWGGRDPHEQWHRSWDGSWRLLLFDIPQTEAKLRLRFWRTLRHLHFGCLQGSVWLSPDSAVKLRSSLGNHRIEARALVVIEGKPAAGESNHDLATAAWDFEVLEKRYHRYLNFLERPLPRATSLPEWTTQEIVLWRNALELDPLLPKALLPAGYQGMIAFQRRREVFARLAANRRTTSG